MLFIYMLRAVLHLNNCIAINDSGPCVQHRGSRHNLTTLINTTILYTYIYILRFRTSGLQTCQLQTAVSHLKSCKSKQTVVLITPKSFFNTAIKINIYENRFSLMFRLQTHRNSSTSRTHVRTRSPSDGTPVIRIIKLIRRLFSTLF